MVQTSPRIGVIGAGAIGGFFGLMLSRAGFDVHYLLRSDYDAVRAQGLAFKSTEFGEYRLRPAQAYRDAADMPACDWLLIGAKATANASLAPVINQAAAEGGKVLLLQNGLGVEESLRPLLRDDLHLLGGLCIISAHRAEPGLIEHYAYHQINIGYHSGPAAEGERPAVVAEIRELFGAAEVDTVAMDNLAQARWQKLVMNVPFNGLTVLLNSGTQAIMTQPQTRALVRALMEEVIGAAAACGHPLPEGYLDLAWAATDGKPDFKASMTVDYEHRRPLELDAIYKAPLDEAAKVGFPMPKVEMLYQTLCFLDERNRA